MWLCAPLCNVQAINDRLDAVEDLLAHPLSDEQFGKMVRGMPDLERLVRPLRARALRRAG